MKTTVTFYCTSNVLLMQMYRSFRYAFAAVGKRHVVQCYLNVVCVNSCATNVNKHMKKMLIKSGQRKKVGHNDGDNCSARRSARRSAAGGLAFPVAGSFIPFLEEFIELAIQF